MNKTDQKAVTDPRTVAGVAIKMLFNASICDAMPERVSTLANDVEALANDEFDGDVEAAQRELETRIGGLKNLLSYSNCLVIGARKRLGI